MAVVPAIRGALVSFSLAKRALPLAIVLRGLSLPLK
jgi:hypothetical protein